MTELSNEHVQKSCFYYQYSPFSETIERQGRAVFEEIRENLSRTIQSGELDPGFVFWSDKLKRYHELYRFNYSKADHLKLVHFYLSVLLMNDLTYALACVCFDLLCQLLRKTRLLTRHDLVIDWRILYHWARRIADQKRKAQPSVILPKDIDVSLFLCAKSCSPYFTTSATQEILDTIRPHMCPFDGSMSRAIQMFDLFLPVNLPPALHEQGFKLWLAEFFTLWQSIYNQTGWELYLTGILSSVAWNNIGSIDWQPWVPQIFTCLLRGFALPSGEMQLTPRSFSYAESDSAKWIVAMVGNGSVCLQYLRDLLNSVRSFYHPSNTGKFQETLAKFISCLSEYFARRVHLEQRAPPVWHFNPLPSHRLTEQHIVEFVHCVHDYALMCIFNKDYAEEGVTACQYLAMLRPDVTVPSIVQMHFAAIDNLSEPHRYTSVLKCLTRLVRPIAQQTPTYSEGQSHVLPLLMSVLPGIDLNDSEKTSSTLEFIEAMLTVITCVDCSSDAELTEIDVERQVCRSTRRFGQFVEAFFDRIFHMMSLLQADVSDAIDIDTKADVLDQSLLYPLTNIIQNLTQQCSTSISELVSSRLRTLTNGSCLSPKVRNIAATLMRGLVAGRPAETLQCFLPQVCESIARLCSEVEPVDGHKDNIELNWHLSLFTELVRARGDRLLAYRPAILSVFDRCMNLTHPKSYYIVAFAACNTLDSLTQIYPVDFRLTVPDADDCLPIRTWGQSVDVHQLNVRFHTPTDDELRFASEFVVRFLYPLLTRLKENNLTMSNQERLRTLTLVQAMAVGCFRAVPRVQSAPVCRRALSMVAQYSKYPTPRSLHPATLKLPDDLRAHLLVNIGRLLDELFLQHSNDVASIQEAIRLYSSITLYYGVVKDLSAMWESTSDRTRLLRNRLYGPGRDLRCLLIEKMFLELQELELSEYGSATNADRQVILQLFELSVHRYRQIRRVAQAELFYILAAFRSLSDIVVEQMLALFDAHAELAEHQIKGCLYVLLGGESIFLPTTCSWMAKEKLWPLIVRIAHTSKHSVQKLIDGLHGKLDKQLITELIAQSANEEAKRAAARLLDELTLLLRPKAVSLSFRQQNMAVSFVICLLQKQLPIPSSTVDVLSDLLTHDNANIRKRATKAIVIICHVQKPPKIYAERSLSGVQRQEGHPGDRDDNLWATIDTYRPATTQSDWEKSCFLDGSFHGYYLWPQTIRYAVNKRARYTDDDLPAPVAVLYHRFRHEDFLNRALQMMLLSDEKELGKTRLAMFKGLFRNFGVALLDGFLKQLYVLIREKSGENENGSHRLAAEIVAGLVRGSKHWSLEMLDELWDKLRPLFSEICADLNPDTVQYWLLCFEHSLENRDPRRMHRLIDFLRDLMNTTTARNAFVDATRWSLLQTLGELGWRIPSVWRAIQEHALTLLAHPSFDVRTEAASLLAMSVRYDVTLFDGSSLRHPSADQLMDELAERLQQAIDVHARTAVSVDPDARRALNCIESVLRVHTQFFRQCRQPVKDGIIRLFPYLCELEGIGADEVLKKNVISARSQMAVSYWSTSFFNALVEQLTKICASSKWHARRAALLTIQTTVFCNLFNARPAANQVRQLVVQRLCDEQIEVRIAASQTLADLYQCGYIQVTGEDLEYFRAMRETDYVTFIAGKKEISSKKLVARHGGVLGLCAVVRASPYDIPIHVPSVLMLLCEHSHDPNLIQTSVKECLAEFRRTHHDSWHEHRERFSEDQLAVLADVLISHSYYA